MTPSLDKAIVLIDSILQQLDADPYGAVGKALAAPATGKPAAQKKEKKNKKTDGDKQAKKPWVKDAAPPPAAAPSDPLAQADLRVCPCTHRHH
jgi:hypothetical protein